MALQTKEVRTEGFDDFEYGGSGRLGVNEIIPLISQACVEPTPVTNRQT